jgi:dUTPase
MENQEIQIIETTGGIEVIEAQQRAEYDIQISTAKRFPRDLTRVKNNCIALVTMDKETAESCRYALPRGGKTISGPSVHMARIMVQQYGNIRVTSSIKQITENQVISEAACFDLETNYACKIEVRRSIMQNEYVFDPVQNKRIKTGRMVRMDDDMVTVTGNASNSIALRNAILNVIPRGITDATYKAAVQMVTGDLTDETKLILARDKALKYFKDQYSVTEARLLKAMGLNSINQIKPEQIADMKAMIQSLKDGDSTVDEMFGPKSGDEKKEDLKKNNKPTEAKLDLP